ncbi:hypothetical protein AVEN_123100-1 [Araneus ventricosus]|uniref:Uncharacterized protein n=1 Tax=Araneus ventricosus TaxID=182803 RepID=A0A4Y2KBS7_ARAVE|nr:hypothetical protein AVEN_123100-1 [Araneus ventricosus]
MGAKVSGTSGLDRFPLADLVRRVSILSLFLFNNLHFNIFISKYKSMAHNSYVVSYHAEIFPCVEINWPL